MSKEAKLAIAGYSEKRGIKETLHRVRKEVKDYFNLNRDHSREATQQKRKNYKLALITPYLDKVPNDVVRAMLDHDLIDQDEDGRPILSEYTYNLEIGRVDAVIESHLRKADTIFDATSNNE